MFRVKPGNAQSIFRNLGTTPIKKKKRSRSEKAILGATLGIPGYSRSNSRNGTHDLIYVKTLFSEQLLERLLELAGRLNFSPNSRSVFFKIGVVPARQTFETPEIVKHFSWSDFFLPDRWPSLGSLSTSVLGLVTDHKLRQVVCLICQPSAGFALQAANIRCQNMKRKPFDNWTSEPGAQKHSKSILWGTFRHRPFGTPVNGGRDHKRKSLFGLFWVCLWVNEAALPCHQWSFVIQTA